MFKHLFILAFIFSTSFANAEDTAMPVGIEPNEEIIGTIKKTTDSEQKEAHKVLKKKKSKKVQKKN